MTSVWIELHVALWRRMKLILMRGTNKLFEGLMRSCDQVLVHGVAGWTYCLSRFVDLLLIGAVCLISVPDLFYMKTGSGPGHSKI